jgi:chemotaxis protein methyltransferase CheR
MALNEGLRFPRAWNIDILGCDLSRSCITTATRGQYPDEKLHRLPAVCTEKYLAPSGGGAIIRDEIKAMTRFTVLNLSDVIAGKGFPGLDGTAELFDVIFCRNVMIYFSPACQQKLVDILFDLLVPGGYLFTGDAEPLHLYSHAFETIQDAGCLVYRKMEITKNAAANSF